VFKDKRPNRATIAQNVTIASSPQDKYFSTQVKGVFNSSLSGIMRSGNGPPAILQKELICISDSKNFIKNLENNEEKSMANAMDK
jgi:hypothetical protein